MLKYALGAFFGMTFLTWFTPIYFWLRPEIDMERVFEYGFPYINFWIYVSIYSVLFTVLVLLGVYCEHVGRKAHKERFK